MYFPSPTCLPPCRVPHRENDPWPAWFRRRLGHPPCTPRSCPSPAASSEYQRPILGPPSTVPTLTAATAVTQRVALAPLATDKSPTTMTSPPLTIRASTGCEPINLASLVTKPPEPVGPKPRHTMATYLRHYPAITCYFRYPHFCSFGSPAGTGMPPRGYRGVGGQFHSAIGGTGYAGTAPSSRTAITSQAGLRPGPLARPAARHWAGELHRRLQYGGRPIRADGRPGPTVRFRIRC
jgi:hypothetical protein